MALDYSFINDSEPEEESSLLDYSFLSDEQDDPLMSESDSDPSVSEKYVDPSDAKIKEFESENSLLGNASRKVGERFAELGGNLYGAAETVGGFLDDRMNVGGFAATPGAPLSDEKPGFKYLDPVEWDKYQESESSMMLEDLQKEFTEVEYGSVEENYWEKMKSNPNILEKAKNLAAFGIETGIASLPDMFFAVTMFPAWWASFSEQIAQDRASNDGRKGEPSEKDWAIAGTTTALIGAMEKFGFNRIASAFVAGGTAGTKILKAAVGEGGTEFVQEQMEYGAEILGTEAGSKMTGSEYALASTERGLQGLVGGVTVGGTLGTVGAIVNRGERQSEPPEQNDQTEQPVELFTPTHRAGGGQDVQTVTRRGNIVRDTYINQAGKVFRDSNAVEVVAPDLEMDANVQAERIRAEVFGDTDINIDTSQVEEIDILPVAYPESEDVVGEEIDILPTTYPDLEGVISEEIDILPMPEVQGGRGIVGGQIEGPNVLPGTSMEPEALDVKPGGMVMGDINIEDLPFQELPGTQSTPESEVENVEQSGLIRSQMPSEAVEQDQSILNWDTTNRSRRTDEWFEGGMANTDTISGFNDAAENGGNELESHGMGKEATLTGAVENLLNLITNGTDPTRGRNSDGFLDTAPLTSSENAGAGLGTASGTSYRTGPLIMVARPGERIGGDMSGVGAILVNNAHPEAVTSIRDSIQKIRPDILVETYSEAGSVSKQLTSQNVPNVPNVPKRDQTSLNVPTETAPVTAEAITATSEAITQASNKSATEEENALLYKDGNKPTKEDTDSLRSVREGDTVGNAEGLAKYGDDSLSPWLLADGNVVATGQDHYGYIIKRYEELGLDTTGELGYREFSIRHGGVRSSFKKDKVTNKNFASLQLYPGQKLTAQQFKMVSDYVNASEGGADIILGLDSGEKSMSNPEYKPILLSDLKLKHTEAGGAITATSEAITQASNEAATSPTNSLPELDFIPTHETSNGEQVVATEEENVFTDRDGNEVEDNYATPIKKAQLKTKTEETFGPKAGQEAEPVKAPPGTGSERANKQSELKPEAVKKTPEDEKPVYEDPIMGPIDATIDKISDGGLKVDELQSSYKMLIDNEQSIKEGLSKLTKPQLIAKYNVGRYEQDKKARVVDAAYDDLKNDFLRPTATDTGFIITSYSFNKDERQQKELDRIMAITQEMIDGYAEKVAKSKVDYKAKLDESSKGMKNPETIQDYKNILNKLGDDAGVKTFSEARALMPLDQRLKFDNLVAKESRSKRVFTKDEQRTRVNSGSQMVEGEIIETTHTKKGYDLFVVQLAERVDKEDFLTLKNSSKKIGGYYSSYRGNGATPGFTFTEKEQAEAFIKLAAGDTSQATEVAQDRVDSFKDDRSQSSVERLLDMAGKLDDRGNTALNSDRKTNTSKRAGQAASAIDKAEGEIAMAETMNNIANGIENGDIQFLDQVRTKTQIDMLDTFVHVGKSSEAIAIHDGDYKKQENMRQQPATSETVEYIEFPTYRVWRSDLARLGRELQQLSGTKLLGNRLLKIADDSSKQYEMFAKENINKVSVFYKKDATDAVFKTKKEADITIQTSGFGGQAISLKVKNGKHQVVMSPSEAQRRGVWTGGTDTRVSINQDFAQEIIAKVNRKQIRVPWQLENSNDKRKRLRSMNIETAAEFRSALQEYVGLRKQQNAPDKIKEMERSMVGRQKDGLDFFPTPAFIADEMIEAADIQEGMTVLEPSAGMGHIAEQIRSSGVEPDVIEMSNKRVELLEAKGFNVVGRDFMEFNSEDGKLYDRIIMNPPFSDRRDSEHIKHAYDLLKPGGRLVSIAGEGVFFGNDKKAKAFRDWVDSVGGTDEKLDEGTFNDPSLPVSTGVNTRMLVIDKGETMFRMEDADPYLSMRGKDISYEVEVEETGEIYTVTSDAAETMTDIDNRISVLEKLRDCI